jgi:hypothetical protein
VQPVEFRMQPLVAGDRGGLTAGGGDLGRGVGRTSAYQMRLPTCQNPEGSGQKMIIKNMNLRRIRDKRDKLLELNER